MCLIIDVNIASRALLSPNDPDFGDVYNRLFGSNGKHNLKIVYGGKLLDEYVKCPNVLKRIMLLDQAGRAQAIDDLAVRVETKRLEEEGECESDDPHIIALARCSRARVICTHDKRLHADFTNGRFISLPRGKIYQNSTHNHLLKDPCP